MKKTKLTESEMVSERKTRIIVESFQNQANRCDLKFSYLSLPKDLITEGVWRGV
jgi:hypothetical protein